MALTPKQQKTVWIVALSLAGIHFGPGIVMSMVRSFTVQRVAAPAKPSASHPAQAPVAEAPALPAPVSAPDDGFSKLVGIWGGSSVLPNSTICKLRIELRPSQQKPGAYSAYWTKQCGPDAPIHIANLRQQSLLQKVLEQVRPVSAVFAGTPQNGEILFQLDRNLNADPNGCKPTSLTLSPFGDSELSAEWQEGTCPGGQMILKRLQQ